MPNNQKIREELSKLFETVPPNELRKNLQEVFYGYLLARSRIGLWPLNFPEVVEGFYALSVMLDEFSEENLNLVEQ